MSGFLEVKGNDPDRCVFRTLERDPHFYKLYFQASKYNAFQREYFLTKLLSQGVENVVQQEGGELTTPKDLSDRILKNPGDCAAKIANDGRDIPHFITRNIGPNTKTLSEWLGLNQSKPISADVVRTFAFQLVYLVGKMHSQYGVQHNDIYELNIMVKELKDGEKKPFNIVIGQDLFTFDLTEGHLEVFLFDFGSSRMRKSPNSENFRNQWETSTDVTFVVVNPPEVLYSRDFKEKGPESDVFMIGHVLLNMIAHGRNGFVYNEYMGLHFYDITEKEIAGRNLDGKTNYGLYAPSDDNIVFQTLKFSGKKADQIRQLHQMIWLNLIALDVMFNGFTKASTVPNDIPLPAGSKVPEFYANLKIHKEYLEKKYAWLTSVFEKDHAGAFTFVRRLMAFSPGIRRGFALPGSSYCLTAALFHPYFQSFYKGQQSSTPNLLFNPPLLYNPIEINSAELKEQENIFYGELLEKYLRDYPNTIISGAIREFLKNGDKTVFDKKSVSIAEIDDLLTKLYSPSSFPKKDDRVGAVINLVALYKALPSAQQALANAKTAEAAAAKLAQEKAEEAARQAAEKLAKEQAEAAEALRKKNEAEAATKLAAQKAQEAVDKANAETDALKKAAQEAEANRLAEEQAKKEAEKIAAEEKAAKEQAEADAAKQAAEEAKKKAAATQAAEEEAARQATEARKAKAVPIVVAPGPIIEVGSGPFTKDEQNVLWLMRQLTKATDKEYLEKFEKSYGPLENVFTNAYNVLKVYAKKKDFDRIASISETGKIRTNMVNKGRYTFGNIIPYAIDVIAIFYLIFRGTTSIEDFENFFKQSGKPFKSINVGDLGDWSETYLGPFLNQFAQSSGGVVPIPSTPEEKGEASDDGSTQPGSIAPSPGPEALVPAPKQVVSDTTEARQNMIAATEGLIDLMLELIDKKKEAFRATPSQTIMANHTKGIAQNLYTMANALEILQPKMKIAKGLLVDLSNGQTGLKKLLKWVKTTPEFIFDPALKDMSDDEKELLSYSFTATKANYTNLTVKDGFFDTILTHIYFIGVKSILETKEEGSFVKFGKNKSTALALSSGNEGGTVLNFLNKMKTEIKK